MKLTGITIDGYRKLHNIRLMQISPAMNLVYGEKGSGKTRLANFIGGVLFGHANEARQTGDRAALHFGESIEGQLELHNAAEKFVLKRSLLTGNQLDVTPAVAANRVSTSLQHFVGGPLDFELYDNLFSVSFANQSSSGGTANAGLPQTLHRRLGVGIGPEHACDSGVGGHQTQTANLLRLEIEQVTAKISALQDQSQQLQAQITANASSVTIRANQLDQQIVEIDSRLAALTNNPNAQQLAQINVEIGNLKQTISAAVPTYVTPPTPVVDHGSIYYEQLDEIDSQISRWRSVQNDVQQQRVQLKDEMLLWNEMTLESEQHPYHNARKILLNLELRVDQAESQSVQWLNSHGPIDSNQAAGFVNDVCQGMREDLYDLCDELGKQYNQIRHRSAAAELKRLRRCYQEITENVTRLLQRRQKMVDKIRVTDPLGADAIVRADEKFCQCAAHEGYFKARERFVGPVVTIPPAPQMVAPDLTKQRSQLAVLENRRAEIQRHGATDTLEMTQLRSQVMNLRNERNALAPANDAPWKLELANVQTALQSHLASRESLNLRLEEAVKMTSIAPNAILVEASQILARLSHGDLSAAWLVSHGDRIDLQIQDRQQRVIDSAHLTPTMRTQTELSLILAAHRALSAQGLVAPLIIDELFGDFDSDRIDTALQYLAEFSARGHQVIMLTQHRFLIDRANNYGMIKFFDIENRASTALPQPWDAPVVASPATIAFSNAKPIVPNGINPSPVSASHLTTEVLASVATPSPANSTRYLSPEIGRFQTAAAPPVASIKANKIGDRLEYAVTLEDHSPLNTIEIFDSLQLRTLNDSGIFSVGDLLDIDPQQLPSDWGEAGLSRAVVANMQSEVWLLTCVPALRPYDAHVLVACGICEPDQLETSAAQMLLERVQRYLNANEADHEFNDSYRITINRINDWHQGIRRTRQRWRNGRQGRRRSNRGYENGSARAVEVRDDRSNEHRPSNGRPDYDRSDYDRSDYGREHYDRVNRATRSNGPRISRFDDGAPQRAQEIIRADRSSSRSRESRSRESQGREPRSRSTPRPIRSPRMSTPTPETYRRSVPALAPESNRTKETKPAATRTSPQPTKSAYKFYLDLEDHIEAAPSIGPKTAERFEKIGVFTIAEFLKQTAESMAAKLNYKRMSVDVVRGWQQQARLVCRIPNLRGHDAQLLVACEFIEPEEIAALQPQSLFSVIEPFSDTKEGLKIIRSGKKPDLAEITDWIAWAQQTRSLQAA